MNWYVSLTLKWKSLSGDTKAFFDHCQAAEIPSTHQRTPQTTWHSNLYAIAEIRPFSDPDRSMRDAARGVLDQLRDNQILSHLDTLPRFTFSPRHLNHFQDGSTIQFTKHERLSKLRELVACAIHESAPRLIDAHANILPPLGAKNTKAALWGSIARNPDSAAKSIFHQQIEIPSSVSTLTLTATKAILTISDQALTNTYKKQGFKPISLV